MKIKGAKQVHYDSGPNMTPLVDVVMVILIFLMLAGSFAGASHYLVSNLPFTPKGAGKATAPPGFVPDEPLDIRVDPLVSNDQAPATGEPLDANVFRARVGSQVCTNARQLNTVLAQKYQSFINAKIPIDKVQVQISPDRRIAYKYLVLVYQAALEDFAADQRDPQNPHPLFSKVAFANSH